MADTLQQFRPIGVTGLRHSGGFIDEEWLRPLRGERRIRTYKEMAMEPLIAASLLAMELLCRQVTWTMVPVVASVEAQAAAEFARTVLFVDMAQTWPETLTEILSMLTFGFAAHELVYKRRQGAHRDPLLTSQYSDGAIGLQGLEIRSQDTLNRWLFHDGHRLAGMEQRPWEGGGLLTIPEDRLALFQVRSHKQNPEGVSLLRNCYIPWHYKKNIQEYQAIGVERDLAGLPVMYIPPSILDPNDPDHAASYQIWKDAIQGVRRNENEGLLLPAAFDEHGNRLYEITLLTAGGTRQFDTTAILQQYNLEIVLALFTDLLLVGHEQTGSFALSSSKTTLLATALGAILDSITSTVNRVVLPRLWRLNGLPLPLMPSLGHGDIEAVDLAELGGFIVQMSQAGFDVSKLEEMIWQRAGFEVGHEA